MTETTRTDADITEAMRPYAEAQRDRLVADVSKSNPFMRFLQRQQESVEALRAAKQHAIEAPWNMAAQERHNAQLSRELQEQYAAQAAENAAIDPRLDVPMAEHRFFMAKRERRITRLEATLAEAENRCAALMVENRELKRRLAERDASALRAIRAK